MGRVLYYLPSVVKQEDFLAERAAVFGTDPSVEHRGVSGGPDGGEGEVLSLSSGVGRVAYLKAEQEWAQVPGRAWWMGWDRASPPAPRDLARPEQLRGRAVRLADGQDWIVPTARLWIEHEGRALPVDALPQKLGVGADGRLAFSPLARYRTLADAGLRVWQGLNVAQGAISITLPLNDEWQIAVDALSANYHVGPEEVTALGLLTTANLASLLLALIDFEGFVSVLKALEEAAAKKAPAGTSAGSDTVSGETGSRPATPPAS